MKEKLGTRGHAGLRKTDTNLTPAITLAYERIGEPGELYEFQVSAVSAGGSHVWYASVAQFTGDHWEIYDEERKNESIRTRHRFATTTASRIAVLTAALDRAITVARGLILPLWQCVEGRQMLAISQNCGLDHLNATMSEHELVHLAGTKGHFCCLPSGKRKEVKVALVTCPLCWLLHKEFE